jgi:hypothetical protein
MRAQLAIRLAGGLCALGSAVLSGACGGEKPASTPAAEIWFEEVALESGIEFSHVSGQQGDEFLLPESLCGGAALFDMDGDGDLDAYLIQSGDLRASGAGQPGNRLFRNAGDGTFTDVTEGSGADDREYGMGVAVGDYDDDGDLDLYVTNVGRNALLMNDGAGRFTDVTDAAGVGGTAWSAGCAFVDYDRDGDLDLYVANYLRWSIETEKRCPGEGGRPDYCAPQSYRRPEPDSLYRNNGDGTFTDVSVVAGLESAYGNGLGVVTADLTGDGLVDIFVANDGMLNQLWKNNGDGTFTNIATQAGVANDAHGTTKAGMGVDITDVDDDGDFDVLVVNLTAQTDSFFRNEGGYFSDDTAMLGLTNESRKYTRWGVTFTDFDHDGLLDLYQTNGRVARPPGGASGDPYAEENLLYRGQVDGRFAVVSPSGGTANPLIAASRGTAFGDIDNDGDIDVLVCNRDGPAHLLKNVIGDGSRSVILAVVDQLDLADLNASVTCRLGSRTIRRPVRAAYSYCASNDPRVHIGLGESDGVKDVVVQWSDGTTESFGDIAAGSRMTLRRGEGAAP